MLHLRPGLRGPQARPLHPGYEAWVGVQQGRNTLNPGSSMERARTQHAARNSQQHDAATQPAR
jgi:hypothetical protein